MEDEVLSVIDEQCSAMGRAMMRGLHDDIQRLSKEVYMEEKIDWTRWLPTGLLPVNRAARFKPGQVWVFSCAEADTKWFDPIVFRIPGDWVPGDRVDVLARPRHPDSHPFINDGRETHPSSTSQMCLLIQDVGQAEPTPPSLLYGAPNWLEWLPPRNLPPQAVDLKLGMIAACRGPSASRAVYRVDKVGAYGGYDITILAENGENAHRVTTLSNHGWWRTAVVVQDVGQAHPTPPEILYGEPKTKETTMAEAQVHGDQIDWKEHVPGSKRPQPGWAMIDESSVRRGQVYAYWYDTGSRGVVRVERDGRAAGILLAHSSEGAGDTDWSFHGSLKAGKAVLIADANGWAPGYSKAPAHAHKRPAPTAKPKGVREVSIDGQQYVNYDKMIDSDAFERYPYHRVRMPDGTFSLDEKPVMMAANTIDHCHHCGSKQGPFGYANECFPCHGKKEGVTAVEMRKRDGANGSRVRSVTVATAVPLQSHSMLWGGVFSLRE